MALNPLKIEAKRARDLERLAASSPEKLNDLIANLKRHPTGFPRLSEFAQIFRNALGDEDGQPVARLLLSLRRFYDQKNASAPEVFDSLIEGLKNYKLSTEKLESFIKLREQIISLFDLEIIHNSYKTADLYFSHQRHLHAAKILTEIRPIFSLKRDSIGAFLVYSSLKFTLSSQEEDEQTFTVSVKKDEIESLKAECERALQKIAVVESELKKSKSVIVYDGRFID